MPERPSNPTWSRLASLAQSEVLTTLRSLPKALRAQAEPLPVVYEREPSEQMVKDGLEPDILGLFVGTPFEEESSGGASIPAQIILFLDNLWDFSDGDEGLFRQEVRTTLLHELGHYLGLNEGELTDRGLE